MVKREKRSRMGTPLAETRPRTRGKRLAKSQKKELGRKNGRRPPDLEGGKGITGPS